MNTKANQKFRQTHKEIMDAVMILLKNKNIKQITVAEICRMVGINRSTFYEHFLDTYDVIETIAQTISDEAIKVVPKEKPDKENFILMCNHIKEYKEFYSLFFKQDLPISVQNKFFLSSPPPIPDELKKERRISTDIQLEYHCVLFQAGMDAITKKWLSRDCKETPDELYDILQLVYHI